MKIKKLNESMLPSQATLDDCLDDYRQNAFGFAGVEDYVDTNYPMHSQEFKAAVCDYLKNHKNESLQEAWQVGDHVTIKWNEPNFEPYAYATCEYQGKTEDGKHKFKSTTYGWDFIVDLENKKIKTPHDKEYDLWDESGWTKNAVEEDIETSKYIKEASLTSSPLSTAGPIPYAVKLLYQMDKFVIDAYDNEGWLMNGVPDGEFEETTPDEAMQNYNEHMWLIEDDDNPGEINWDDFNDFIDTFSNVTESGDYDQEERNRIIDEADTFVREYAKYSDDNDEKLSKMLDESKSIREDINDSYEVHTFKRDINLASDADEIQQLIYKLSDGVAEDNAQQAFNENENNDLKTLKDAIITAIDVYLEDNEWLGESKSINEDATNPTYSWMIVKMGEDGIHYYYNASKNTFTSDIDEGTRYVEREVINDDFKEVSKNNDNCYMRKILDMPDWEPLKESANSMIYLFPELTDEDLEMAKGYGLKYLGKNHGADGSEDNWVLRGAESSLRMFADKYLGYELHPDYLYDEEDFAGDIINESLMGLELDKDDILDWLAEHEQAWADAERHFNGEVVENDADSPLLKLSVKDLVEWIADHKQLYDDFHRFFYEDNLDEEFLNFDFNQNPDDDVDGIIQ